MGLNLQRSNLQNQLVITFDGRDFREIAIELHQQAEMAAADSIRKAVLLGSYLRKVRDQFPKRAQKGGGFGDWVEANLPFSMRTAWTYIRAHDRQDLLAGNSNITLRDIYNITESEAYRESILIDKPLCPKCNGAGAFRKAINANNAIVITYSCGSCNCNIANKLFKRPFLPKIWFTHDEIEVMPVDRNNAQNASKCSVRGCIAIGSEIHHWAPRHLFNDADCWPQAPLCREHHTEWHRKTETGAFWKGNQ